MKVTGSIAVLCVDELLARISSSDVTPGAGSAGAVALALAAACASKAVAISLKHAPDDLDLKAALASFARVARSALADADGDSVAFEEFMRSGTPAAISELVREGEDMAELIARLGSQIDQIEPRIRANMMGDLSAARSLIDAARSIQQRNEGEALRRR